MRGTFLLACAAALFLAPPPTKGQEDASPAAGKAKETFIHGAIIYACREKAERRRGAGFKDAPRDLGERLSKAFEDAGLTQFQIVEEQTQPVYKAYDSWVFPEQRFKLELNSQGRTPDGGLKLMIQLWQDDLVLLKSDSILRDDSPLFIAGPKWGAGRLVFVLQLGNGSAPGSNSDG